MDLDKALEIIKEETVAFRKKLYERQIPVTDITVDLDDLGMCEPVVHLHLELDDNWFYDQIESK